ncbi:MAG: tetratricopeptide repeat protein [Simkaniaceae bacterium]|nr:tetratricopeptide repeat protein [Simkaniaceae bacterium]
MTISLLCTSCYRVPNTIDPQVAGPIQDHYVKMLPSSFPPLNLDESGTEWGKEYTIGLAFAERLDLYRAVTSFKRAEILMPSTEKIRKEETQYYVILSYYLGRRYDDVVETFNDSDLRYVSRDFKTYHDLLVILYESFLTLGEKDQAVHYYKLIKKNYPETAERLYISTALVDGALDDIQTWVAEKYDAKIERSHMYLASTDLPRMPESWVDRSNADEKIDALVNRYEIHKKSVPKAQTLNALLPGAGYLYVGQKQSALTSFLLNTLFTGAAYAFFNNGYIAAGVITSSLELGWYFGGIFGAGESAKLYNERLYERDASNVMQKEQLFPFFTLKFGF